MLSWYDTTDTWLWLRCFSVGVTLRCHLFCSFFFFWMPLQNAAKVIQLSLLCISNTMFIIIRVTGFMLWFSVSYTSWTFRHFPVEMQTHAHQISACWGQVFLAAIDKPLRISLLIPKRLGMTHFQSKSWKSIVLGDFAFLTNMHY